jgi:PhnB protein
MADLSGQRLVPMLQYDDAPAALAFLCEAFGFEERYRMPMPDGTIGHAEIALGDALVMLATTWKVAGFASPLDLAGLHGQLLCYVDDVDAHYARALRSGATIIAEPRDQEYGSRTYRAVDPEGHRWIFATRLAGAE